MLSAVSSSRQVLFYLVIAVMGVIAGVLPVVLPERLLPFIIGAYVFMGVTVYTLFKPMLLIYFVILSSSTASLFKTSERIDFGQTNLSISGYRWAFVALLAAMVIMIHIRVKNFPRYFILYFIFIAYIMLRWVLSPFPSVGTKDVMYYSMQPIIGLSTFYILMAVGYKKLREVEKLIIYSFPIIILIFVFAFAAGVEIYTPNGPKGLIPPRTIALFMSVTLALSLAYWKYTRHSLEKYYYFLASLIIFFIILFTISRMAAAVALLLFVVTKVKIFNMFKLLGGGMIALVLVAVALWTIPSFRSRTFKSEPTTFTEAIVEFDSNGRLQFMWPATFGNAIEKPIIGWGPGSARIFLAPLSSKEEEEVHPHNEYLQVFHDLGLIGLALFLLFWIVALRRYQSIWKYHHNANNVMAATWSMAAVMGSLILLITSITANTLHYPFVTLPIFVIIGGAEYMDYYQRQRDNSINNAISVQNGNSNQSLQHLR